MNRFLLLVGLFCCAWTTLYGAESEFEEVKVGHVPYITLKSFCKKTSFTCPKEIGKDAFELTNEKRRLELKVDSRECRYNGVLYWLSLPIVMKDDDALISKMDVYKLLGPVLNPKNVGPKMLILGVIIDPGHGGANQGTTARNGLTEKEMNLDVARLLKAELRRNGIPSVLTRNSDKDVSLEDRASFTERYPAYVFVSIHHNEGNSAVRGVETFCLTPENASSTNDGGYIKVRGSQFFRGNYYDSANMLLASLVHREMVKLHPSESDRGVKRARFVVLKKARAPAILVEAGFMSNGTDLGLIKSLKYREKVAQKIASAVKKFIGIMNNSQVPTEKMRRPMDKGIEFVKTPKVPLRKGELPKQESSVAQKSQVQQPAQTAQPPLLVENEEKVDPNEAEDGRGQKESIPADDVQAILQGKVHEMLKAESEASKAKEQKVEEKPSSPAKVEETILSSAETPTSAKNP